MLVSGGQWVTCFDVTYRVSWVTCDVRSSRVRLCSLFPAPNRTFVLPFLSPLPSLIGDLVSIGLVSISTDLVSVTVSGGWLPLAELPWIPACPAQGSWLKAYGLPWNSHPLWQAPSPSSSICDEFKVPIVASVAITCSGGSVQHQY